MLYDPSELIIAATYGRVSTFKQKEGISLDDQDEKMLAYARANNIQVPEEYRFREAVSGLKDERDEYTKIRSLIRERKVNALIVYSSDRHTRDPIHGKIFRAELRRSKATLHIVSEGGQVDIYSAQGELMATIKDAFNKYWLQKILEVTYERKQAYLQQGVPFVSGSVRYGYKRVGKQGNAKAVIDEEVRPIIERIYNWADEGLSAYAIEKLIEGTPAPGDRKNDKNRTRRPGRWSAMTVYRILRDEIYAGVYWANREVVIEDDNGNKVRVPRPREEWVAVAVPPIIGREQWDRVQARLDAGRVERPRMHAKYQYLLARRCRCGECGYSATTYPTKSQGDGRLLLYYKCSSQTSRQLVGPPCKLRMFRAPETDEVVWAAFREAMTNPRMFLEHLSKQQAQQKETYQADQEQLDDIRKLIEQHSAELSVLVSEYARYRAKQSPLADAFRQQMESLESTIEALGKQQTRLKARLARRVISDEEIHSVEALAAELKPYLDNATFERRRAMIEAAGWRFELFTRSGKHIVVAYWKDWPITLEVPHPPRGGRRKSS